MSTILAPGPTRTKVFETARPVAQRLGLSIEMLRSDAKRSGIFTQRGKGATLYWTAEQEARLASWITENYSGKPTTDTEEDPF